MDGDFGDIGFAVAHAVNVGDDDFVGVREALGEFCEEFVGAAVLMGLENGENFGFGAVFVAEGFEGGADFGGMMGVIVVEMGVFALTFVFHAAPGAAEVLEAVFDGGEWNFQKFCCFGGKGSVFEIVIAGNLKWEIDLVLPRDEVGFGVLRCFYAVLIGVVDNDVSVFG